MDPLKRTKEKKASGVRGTVYGILMDSHGEPVQHASSTWQEALFWPLRLLSVVVMIGALLTILSGRSGMAFFLTACAFSILALCDPHIMRNPPLPKGRVWETARLWAVALLALLLLIWVGCLLYSNYDGRVANIWTPAGIVGAATVLWVLRLLSHLASHSSGIAGPRLVSELLANCAAFMVCYVATLRVGFWYQFAGLLFAALNLARVVIYRVILDIFRREIDISQRGPAGAFIKGFLDYIPRAYLYTAFSFSVFQIIVEQYSPGAFEVRNPSASEFLDFLYFNVVTISTVGYGDISPKTPGAKLLCTFEILFALFILVTLASILAQSVTAAKANSGRGVTSGG